MTQANENNCTEYSQEITRLKNELELYKKYSAHSTYGKNEDKFNAIFNNSTDAIVIHSKEGDVIEMNTEFTHLLQLPLHSHNANIFELLPEKDRKTFKQKLSKLHPPESVVFESEIVTFGDNNLHIEIKSKAIEYLHKTYILTIIQNISSRKKFERELIAAIVETEEKERARFAADLHDDLGPTLSTIKMLVSILKDSPTKENITHISTQLYDLVSESIRSIRETSNSISPHILKNYGIIAATNPILQSIQQKYNIKINTNCETIRFENTTEIIYYRILRELLNNTIKHAEAKNIEIELVYEKKILKLAYKDDGKGFDLQNLENGNKRGLGLFNIINRLKSLDSKHSLQTSIGNGIQFELKTKTISLE